VTRSASGKRTYTEREIDPLDCISAQFRERGYTVLGAFLESRECFIPLFRGYDCGSCLRRYKARLAILEDHG
jgi:hypothetical protein